MGIVIGVYATPTISEARAQLVRRLRELEAVASWLDEDPTDRNEERR